MNTRSLRSGKHICTEVATKGTDEDEVVSVTPSRPTTRTLTDFWLVGHPSASITGAKLPDCRQVIKYFM